MVVRVSLLLPAQPPAPVADCGTFDLGCHASDAVNAVFDRMVTAAAEAAARIVVEAASWWVSTPSVDPQDPAVRAAQVVTQPLVLVMLVGSVLVQAMRVVLSRKGEPVVAVFFGLARFGLVSALGLAVLHGALLAGDALAEHVLGGAARNFAFLMRDVLLGPGGGEGSLLTLLLAAIAMVLGLVQWVLMALRQAGLLVLAAMLPLAASGSLTKATRGWLDRLAPWLIALVVYKPVAALVYYIGFSYLSTLSSNTPGGLGTALTGVTVLFLAVIAMPLMMRFFAWSSVQVAGERGGGGTLGMLGAVGAMTLAGHAGRSAAVQHASFMDSAGPGSAPTAFHPPGGAPPRGSLGIGGAAGPAAGGSAPGAAAAGSAAAVPAAAALAAAEVARAAREAPGSAARHMSGGES